MSDIQIGKKFGRWTVLEKSKDLTYVRKTGRKVKQAYWICQCDCGTKRTVTGSSLRAGRSKSCGCLCKEVAKARWTLPSDLGAKNRLFNGYRRAALNRGHTFTLTFEQFINLTQKRCHYCGVGPSQSLKNCEKCEEYQYNGVDRLDNNLGYELSNCVSCCGKCNIAKYTMSETEFLDLIKSIYNYRLNNK